MELARRIEAASVPFDVVCLSHLRWDFVWQRPQQLLSRCAEGRRVFFFEEPLPTDGEPRLELRDAGGVTVAVPRLPADGTPEQSALVQETLLRELLDRCHVREYVLWFYTPMATGFTRTLTPRAVVYDCMDDLTGFVDAPPEMGAAEAELLERADIVFTGGRSLFEAKRPLHPNVHLFPSSVDVTHFARAREEQADPEDQAAIPRPRLGFAGVIDERLDRDLVAELALLRPDFQLVFVGPVVKIAEASLPAAANIHYLGPKPYAELPGYLAGWDVAMLPFARNKATRFISPTKTPEYLAAGCGVVSTPIADIVQPYGEAGLVLIAEDAQGFAAACDVILAEDGSERRRLADSFLTESSWDYTWADMHTLVAALVAERHPGPEPEAPPRPAGGHSSFRAGPRYDVLVVGAGFAGAVFAERVASQLAKRVLVVDRRSHIGGNAYDHYDDAGILVHRYGPHIFHTNSRTVFDYLSQFTEWRQYEHRVLASVDGLLVPFPINIDTVNMLYNLDLSSEEFEAFLAARAEPRRPVRTSEDVVISKVGRELYTKFFRNYTRKQWNMDPSELDASVTARVPTRDNRDARYFTDVYQAMPLHGYTRMFERMLAHPNIKVLLNTDYREFEGLTGDELTVYTGPIDEFFDLRYGKLPYRSLDFRFETVDTPVHQPAAVVNYPNEHAFTRVTEFKYLTGQAHPRTTLVYEYPTDVGDPYYPIPRPENAELYAAYRELADQVRNTVFVGRLATYRYYNMDQVVAQSLTAFQRLNDTGLQVADADIGPARSVGWRRTTAVRNGGPARSTREATSGPR